MNYYEELKKLKESGDLIVTLVVGPPRSGTTALEKFIYEQFSYSGQVNHPGLGNEKEDATWQEVYENVQDSIKQNGTPVVFLIKNTSHYIHPGKDLQNWLDISNAVILCIRNPLLQVESLLGLILDKIYAGGGKNIHI
jgi:hypothetical protein